MKIVNGDILDIKEGVIVHQVNCKGVMGAGLALQIRKKYPKVYDDYKLYCDQKKDKKYLLGGICSTDINENLTIVNLFGQLNYGRDRVRTSYFAFWNALEKIKIAFKDKQIYFPYGIGCGLAGGDWDFIYGLIRDVFPNAIIVKYNK